MTEEGNAKVAAKKEKLSEKEFTRNSDNIQNSSSSSSLHWHRGMTGQEDIHQSTGNTNICQLLTKPTLDPWHAKAWNLHARRNVRVEYGVGLFKERIEGKTHCRFDTRCSAAHDISKVSLGQLTQDQGREGGRFKIDEHQGSNIGEAMVVPVPIVLKVRAIIRNHAQDRNNDIEEDLLLTLARVSLGHGLNQRGVASLKATQRIGRKGSNTPV